MGLGGDANVVFVTVEDALGSRFNRVKLHQLANIVTLSFLDHLHTSNYPVTCGVVDPTQPLQLSVNLEEVRHWVATSMNSAALNDIPLNPSFVVQFLQTELEKLGQGYYYHFWVFSDLAPQRLIEILQPLHTYRSQIIVIQPPGSTYATRSPLVQFFQGVPDPGTVTHPEEASYCNLVSKIAERFYQPYPVLFRIGQLVQEAGVSFVPGWVNRIDVVDIVGFSPLSLCHNVVFTSRHRLVSTTNHPSCLLKALLVNLQSESLFAVARVSSDNEMGLVQVALDGRLMLGILHPDFPLPGPWYRDCHVVLKSGLTPLTSSSLWKSRNYLNHVWAHDPNRLIRRLYRYILKLSDHYPLLVATLKALNQAHQIYSLERVVLAVSSFLDQEISTHPPETIEFQKLQAARSLLCLNLSAKTSPKLMLPDRILSFVSPVDCSSWIHAYQFRSQSALIIQIKPNQEVSPRSVPSTPTLAQAAADTTSPTSPTSPTEMEDSLNQSKQTVGDLVPTADVPDSSILNGIPSSLELESNHFDLPAEPVAALLAPPTVEIHAASAPETVRNSPPPPIPRSQSLAPADPPADPPVQLSLEPAPLLNSTETVTLNTTASSSGSDPEPPLAQLDQAPTICNEPEPQPEESTQDSNGHAENLDSIENHGSVEEANSTSDSQGYVPMESESEPSDSDVPVKAPLARITKLNLSLSDSEPDVPKRKLRQRSTITSTRASTRASNNDSESQSTSDPEPWQSGKRKLRRVKSPALSNRTLPTKHNNLLKPNHSTRSSTATRSGPSLKREPSPRKRLAVNNPVNKSKSKSKLPVLTNSTCDSNTAPAKGSSWKEGSLSTTSTSAPGVDIDDSSTTTSEDLVKTRPSRQPKPKNPTLKPITKPNDPIKKVGRYNPRPDAGKGYLTVTSKRNSISDSLSSTSSNDEGQPEANSVPKLEPPEPPEPPITPNGFAHMVGNSKQVPASPTNGLTELVTTTNSDAPNTLADVNQPNLNNPKQGETQLGEPSAAESQQVTDSSLTEAPSIKPEQPDTGVSVNHVETEKPLPRDLLSVPVSGPVSGPVPLSQNSTLDGSQGEPNGAKSKKGKPKKNPRAKPTLDKDDKPPAKRKAPAKTKDLNPNPADELEQPSKRKYNRKKNIKLSPPLEHIGLKKPAGLTFNPADSKSGDSPGPSSETGPNQTGLAAGSNTQLSLTELTKLRFNSLFSRQPKKPNSGLSTARPNATNATNATNANPPVSQEDASTEVPPHHLLPHTSLVSSEPAEIHPGVTTFSNNPPEPADTQTLSHPPSNPTNPNNSRLVRMYTYVPIEETSAPTETVVGYDNTNEPATRDCNPAVTRYILPQVSATNTLSQVAPGTTSHLPLLPYTDGAVEVNPNTISPNPVLVPGPDDAAATTKKPKPRKRVSKKALLAEETQDDASQGSNPLPKPKPRPRKTKAPKKATVGASAAASATASTNPGDKLVSSSQAPVDLSVPPPPVPPPVTSNIPRTSSDSKGPSSATKPPTKLKVLKHASIIPKFSDGSPPVLPDTNHNSSLNYSHPLPYYGQEDPGQAGSEPKVLRHNTLNRSLHSQSNLADPIVYSHQSYSGMDSTNAIAGSFNPPTNPVILSHTSILSSANKKNNRTNHAEFYDPNTAPINFHSSQGSSYDNPYPVLIQSSTVASQMNYSQPYTRPTNPYQETRGMGSHSILHSNILNSAPLEDDDLISRQLHPPIDQSTTQLTEEETDDSAKKSSLRHLLN